VSDIQYHVFFALCDRKRMWSTRLKKISTVRYWVWQWLATFGLREDSHRLVRHAELLSWNHSHITWSLWRHNTLFTHPNKLVHTVKWTHCCVFLTDELIAAIHGDIEEAKTKLELPEHLKLKEDNFFKTSVSTTANQILNGHRL